MIEKEGGYMSQREKPLPYDKSTIALASATIFAGMEQFADCPYQGALAQVFCFAVRDMILNELEGITLPTAEVLAGLVKRLHSSAPAEVRETFSRISPEEFDDWYKHIRINAAKEGVDLAEFANALHSIPDIAAAVMQAATDPAADETGEGAGSESVSSTGGNHLSADKDLMVALARDHESAGRWQSAIECYDQALNADPLNPTLWLNKAVVLERIGRAQEAIDCYTRGLAVAPRDRDLW